MGRRGRILLWVLLLVLVFLLDVLVRTYHNWYYQVYRYKHMVDKTTLLKEKYEEVCKPSTRPSIRCLRIADELVRSYLEGSTSIVDEEKANLLLTEMLKKEIPDRWRARFMLKVFEILPREKKADYAWKVWKVKDVLARIPHSDSVLRTKFDWFIYSWIDFLFREKGVFFSSHDVDPSSFSRPLGPEVSIPNLVGGLMKFASENFVSNRQDQVEWWRVRLALYPILPCRALLNPSFAIRDLSFLTPSANSDRDFWSASQTVPNSLWQYLTHFSEEERSRYLSLMEEALEKVKNEVKGKEARGEVDYLLAMIRISRGDCDGAIPYLKRIRGRYRGSARAILKKILSPYASVMVSPYPLGQGSIAVKVRNQDKVWLRFYRVSIDELLDRGRLIDKSALTEFEVYSLIREKEPVKMLEVDLPETRKSHNLFVKKRTLDLDDGIYVFIATKGRYYIPFVSYRSAGLVNLSRFYPVMMNAIDKTVINEFADIVFSPSLYKFSPLGRQMLFLFDAQTGRLVPSAYLHLYKWIRGDEDRWKKEKEIRIKNGIGEVIKDVKIERDSVRAGFNGAFVLTRGQVGWRFELNKDEFDWADRPGVRFFLMTSRPVYRPGERIRVFVLGMRRDWDEVKVLSGKKIKIGLFREGEGFAQDKKSVIKEVVLDEFGTASVEFDLPKDALLGRYIISVSADGKRFYGRDRELSGEYGALTIRVEAIKKQKIRVRWSSPEPMLIERGDKLVSEGRVEFTTGDPVRKAKVKYNLRILKSFWLEAKGETLFSEAGETYTDDEGKFRIAVNKKKIEEIVKKQGSVRKVLELTIVSNSGETFSGEYPVYIWSGDTEEIGLGEIVIDRSWIGRVDKNFYLLGEEVRLMVSDVRPGQEIRYRIKDGKEKVIKEGILVGKEKMPATVSLKLDEGSYKAEFWDGKNWQIYPFYVVDKQDPSKSGLKGDLFLLDRRFYEGGNVCRVLLGGGDLKGEVLLLIKKNDWIVRQIRKELKGGYAVVEIPLDDKLEGGFSVYALGITDDGLWTKYRDVSIANTHRELKFSVEGLGGEVFPVVSPGADLRLKVEVKDREGRPSQARVGFRMFDSQLDVYSPEGEKRIDPFPPLFLTFSEGVSSGSIFTPSLYSPCPGFYSPLRVGARKAIKIGIGVGVGVGVVGGIGAGIIKVMSSYPVLIPVGMIGGAIAMRLYMRRVLMGKSKDDYVWYLQRNGVIRASSSEEDTTVQYEPYYINRGIPRTDSSGGISEGAMWQVVGNKGVFGISAYNKGPVELRKDFSLEGAFLPRLLTNEKGTLRFSITMPEEITLWHLFALAVDRLARVGVWMKDVITNKRMVLRVSLPRMVREGDRFSIGYDLSNRGYERISADLWAKVVFKRLDGGEEILLDRKISSFELGPRKSVGGYIPVDVPSGRGALRIEVWAEGDGLSDGESRTLPVYPASQWIILSNTAVLGKDEERSIPLPFPGKGGILREEIGIRVSPQLVSVLFASLPYVVDYPHLCAEQAIDAYLPLAIMDKIYQENPRIRTWAEKVANSDDGKIKEDLDSIFALWDVDEVPDWYSYWDEDRLISLLDPELVEIKKKRAFKTLKQAQLPSGGWSWWPDWPWPDLNITVYILDSFALARDWGLDVPDDMVKKGLNYLKKEGLSLALDYLTNFGEAKMYYQCVLGEVLAVLSKYSEKGLVEKVISEQYAKKLEKMGQEEDLPIRVLVDLAWIYYGLGKDERLRATVERIFSRAKEEGDVLYWNIGMWDPSGWYSNPEEISALMLRLMLRAYPEDDRIPKIVKGLLRLRQAGRWTNTKSTAMALFALMDYYRRTGALEDRQELSLSCGDWNWHKGFEPFEEVRPQEMVLPKGIAGNCNSVRAKKTGPGFMIVSTIRKLQVDGSWRRDEAQENRWVSVERKFYRIHNGKRQLLKAGDKVKVGDEIEVVLKIKPDVRLRYVFLRDPRLAGLDDKDLLSGYVDNYYREIKDNANNFFFLEVDKFQKVSYRLIVSRPGIYRTGPAVVQAMYAPDISAMTDSFYLVVE